MSNEALKKAVQISANAIIVPSVGLEFWFHRAPTNNLQAFGWSPFRSAASWACVWDPALRCNPLRPPVFALPASRSSATASIRAKIHGAKSHNFLRGPLRKIKHRFWAETPNYSASEILCFFVLRATPAGLRASSSLLVEWLDNARSCMNTVVN